MSESQTNTSFGPGGPGDKLYPQTRWSGRANSEEGLRTIRALMWDENLTRVDATELVERCLLSPRAKITEDLVLTYGELRIWVGERREYDHVSPTLRTRIRRILTLAINGCAA